MKLRYPVIILAATMCLLARPATAATVLLELKDPQGVVIKGESTEDKHKEKIEIERFSLNVHVTAGKPFFTGLQLIKGIDKTSPLLYLHCAQGNRLQGATLIVRQGPNIGLLDYYTIKLSNVQISSVSTTGNDDGQKPKEEFTLTAGLVEFSYSPIDPTGKLGTPVTSKLDFSATAP